MRDHHPMSRAVVVGIDGSRSAVDAALWAVDEAVDRDVPLRLVCAIEPHATTEPQQAAHDLAAAEVAVRQAFTAVESTEMPVKIEIEILQAQPVNALRAASRDADMLCVGAAGLQGSSAGGHVGSTAAALAVSAQCPVAVVGCCDPLLTGQRWVVVEVDESEESDGILRRGLDEARLRGAPLRVLATWQSRFTDIHDCNAIGNGNRQAKAQLELRLARWRRLYPDLDIKAAAVHCNVLGYLAQHAESIQLVVVGHGRSHGIREIVGAPGYAALHKARCSVLVSEPQNVL